MSQSLPNQSQILQFIHELCRTCARSCYGLQVNVLSIFFVVSCYLYFSLPCLFLKIFYFLSTFNNVDKFSTFLWNFKFLPLVKLFPNAGIYLSCSNIWHFFLTIHYIHLHKVALLTAVHYFPYIKVSNIHSWSLLVLRNSMPQKSFPILLAC